MNLADAIKAIEELSKKYGENNSVHACYTANGIDKALAILKKVEAASEIAPDLADDRDLILGAMKYRSGNDSCNSFYMGSMATAGLYHELGISYMDGDFKTALAIASPEVVARVKKRAQKYIDYMLAHPVKRCPCCGQITGLEK